MRKTVMTLLILFVAASGAFAKDAMQARADALKQGLGKQVGKERAVAGGRAWDFEKGSVYWSAKAGARLVSGNMLKKYKDLGAEGGALGYPVSDEQPTATGVQQTFEHGFITANRAGDTSVEILAGVNIAEGSLVVTTTGTPPILGIDNDGTLHVRGNGNVEALLRCTCIKIEKKFSTRGSCAATINGDMAACVPAPACEGSCAFEVVDK
jgi:uncharacterized Zn-binding protein involved in type VI secretion